MNPAIALITDFGTKDYFVGAMKGAILLINENATIVDITHEIAPQEIRAAGFTLRSCYRDFPVKTVFVAVVDPGVGSNRRALLVETEDYYFIAPDNGLLSFVFNETNDFRVYEISDEKFFKHPVSRTFHGRDVFAPVAAHLANGVNPAKFGEQTKDYICLEKTAPRRIAADKIEAEIIYIDRFGNLIVNLKREDLPESFTFEINGKSISRIQNFFAEAETGELFVIAGSTGFLEVCAFQDSAANLLNVKIGRKIVLKENG